MFDRLVVSASTTDARDPSGVARLVRVCRGPAGRFLVVSAIAFWLGGFTFYAAVAVPIGADVLGSHQVQGFVTQQVTNWLNVAGVCALPILFVNALVFSRHRAGWLRRLSLLTLIAMTLIEVELISLHPFLDRLLVASPHRHIIDQSRFDRLHDVYLISTTVQWFIGLLHVWCVCVLWSGTPAIEDPA